MRILLIIISLLLTQNVDAGVRKTDSEIVAEQVGTTSKITVDAWVEGKSEGNSDRHMLINAGYTLSCPGGRGDRFRFQDSASVSVSWYKVLIYSRFELSNVTNGGAYTEGYPARNTYSEILKTDKSAICTAQLKGIVGFSGDAISGSISGLGFEIAGYFASPAVTLTTVRPNEMAMYPPRAGGDGGACAVDTPICDEPNYDPVEDPLLIDLGQDGVQLGEKGVGVNFDMNGDGDQTKMQWVQYNGNEAFLAMDLNDNGVVDNGTELFGTGTKMLPQALTHKPVFQQLTNKSMRLAFAKGVTLAPNGFVALAQFDQLALGGNDDGYISLDDDIWNKLFLWLDTNADGISTNDEILQLSDIGITQIDIIPNETNRIDSAGNSIPLWSWATDENNIDNNKYEMVDVFFRLITD